ncbi:farnesol dehydrogenase-like [Anthonomus grandis grandis]|uniref:farnesol dehydrogenase-like n=1 Tax=Anthonomus grandis grandis TaxID=2921223 RepID=UPI0021663ACD|nr:farnesol dehydrogenase-like [Anthonomus grandis grandis]
MVLSLTRWVGKVAVVTGASAGIGAATASQLVRSGILVAGLARRVERIEKLAASLEGSKGKLYAFKCDITNEEEVIAVFKEINDTIGTIQILINNAGLGQPTDLIDGDSKMWRTCIDTNVFGLCVATREAIKYMKAAEVEGHVVHVNSTAGHVVYNIPKFNVYGATKYAVTALAETLRREINMKKLPVRITSVSPGYVSTEFTFVAYGQETFDMPSLKPEDVADAIKYTLSTPQTVNIKEINLEAYGATL